MIYIVLIPDSLVQPSNIIDITRISRRVSEIIKNMSPKMNYFSSCNKIEATNDVQKKYTRISMLRMKEELNDLSMTDSHHAHEYFVVNSFRIFYNLELSSSSSTIETSLNNVENFQGYSVPSQLVPLKIETVNDFLSELNQTAVFPKNVVPYTDYKNTFMTKNKELTEAFNWKYADAVYEFIQEKKEIGVCSQELLVIHFLHTHTHRERKRERTIFLSILSSSGLLHFKSAVLLKIFY